MACGLGLAGAFGTVGFHSAEPQPADASAAGELADADCRSAGGGRAGGAGVQLWLDARNTWRLWRTLLAGVPLERPKPYRRQLRLGQLVYAATLVVYTLNLMISFQNMGGSPSGWDHAEDILDRQTGQAPAETVAVSLAELDNVEPSWFSAERKSLPIAPEMYDSRQYAPLPEYGQVRAETACYRMLTEGLARALTAELTENRAGFYDNLPAIPLEPVEAPGLDGFWWAEEMSGAETPISLPCSGEGHRSWLSGTAAPQTCGRKPAI